MNNTVVVINCTLCPYKGLAFDWTRPGEELSSVRFKITNCSLIISPVLMEDAGQYVCRTAWKGDESIRVLEERATLVVLGKGNGKIIKWSNRRDLYFF